MEGWGRALPAAQGAEAEGAADQGGDEAHLPPSSGLKQASRVKECQRSIEAQPAA